MQSKNITYKEFTDWLEHQPNYSQWFLLKEHCWTTAATYHYWLTPASTILMIKDTGGVISELEQVVSVSEQ